MTNKIRPGVQKVIDLGRMPDESNDEVSEEEIDRYSDYLEEIESPINLQEAKELIKLFPDVALYGVEYDLLHLFESVFPLVNGEEYKEIIKQCPSEEWRDRLLTRYANSLK